MTQYRIVATGKRVKNGWTVAYQIPTFLLDGNTQGIITAQHAREIALSIINPYDEYESVDVAVFVEDEVDEDVEDAIIVEDQGLLETYSQYTTKFDHPYTNWLYCRSLEGMVADEEYADEQGNWRGRFGRRVLCEDDRGFVFLHKFTDIAAAVEYMDEWAKTNAEGGEWWDAGPDDSVRSNEPQAMTGYGSN